MRAVDGGLTRVEVLRLCRHAENMRRPQKSMFQGECAEQNVESKNISC